MGRLLRDEDLVPDRIVSSTAVRARTTAELVADELGYRGTVQRSRDLYLASAPDIIRVLGNVGGDASRLLVVGHNPGLEELVAALTGGFAALPTAAMAQVDLDVDVWPELTTGARGRLVNLWRPRELEDGE